MGVIGPLNRNKMTPLRNRLVPSTNTFASYSTLSSIMMMLGSHKVSNIDADKYRNKLSENVKLSIFGKA